MAPSTDAVLTKLNRVAGNDSCANESQQMSPRGMPFIFHADTLHAESSAGEAGWLIVAGEDCHFLANMTSGSHPGGGASSRLLKRKVSLFSPSIFACINTPTTATGTTVSLFISLWQRDFPAGTRTTASRTPYCHFRFVHKKKQFCDCPPDERALALTRRAPGGRCSQASINNGPSQQHHNGGQHNLLSGAHPSGDLRR